MYTTGTVQVHSSSSCAPTKAGGLTSTSSCIFTQYKMLHIYDCSDAFDLHYGVGILRLKEGLDVASFQMSHFGDDRKL